MGTTQVEFGAQNCYTDGAKTYEEFMSSAEARSLEKQLGDTGTLRVSHEEAKALFHFRARKLVRMSGTEALKRIRAGKCGQSPAWMELTAFATLL